MPPRKTDKKVHELAKTPFDYDIVREPLPVIDSPVDTTATKDQVHPLVTDAKFPEWSRDSLEDENWHGEDEVFEDCEFDTGVLPLWIQGETVAWIRACDFIQGLPQATSGNKDNDQGEKRGSTKSKAKETGQQDWGEVDVDETTGKLQPRIVVLPETTSRDSQDDSATAMASQWPPPRSLPLDRGFVKLSIDPPHLPKSSEESGQTSSAETAGSAESQAESESGMSMPERDTIGASLLRLVAIYSGVNNAPFLWEAIFPQDSSGRPCYNPGGKYAVKLFVSGLWRKVLVDDRVPVDKSGRSTIVSSSEQREIWPVILAKAIYKVASQICQAPSHTSICEASSISAFMAVAAMALTGWLPSPISGPPPPDKNWSLSAVRALATRVVAGGTPRCSSDDIALTATSNLPGSPSKRRNLRSGRRRRRGRSREPSEEMLAQATLARNTAILALREKIATAREELVLVASVDRDGKFMLRPILAVVAMPSFSDSDMHEDQVLLDWSCAFAKPDDFRSGAVAPPTNAVTTSLRGLLNDSQTSLLTLVTRRSMPFTAQSRRAWTPTTSDDDHMATAPVPTGLRIQAASAPATLAIMLQADNLWPVQRRDESDSKVEDISYRTPAKRIAHLILEEILAPQQRIVRTDEPVNEKSISTLSRLIFLRVTLPLDSVSPVTTTTIAVPIAPEGRLYQLSILAPVCAAATFCCNVPIVCDDISTLYKELGGVVTTTSGAYDSIRDGCEIVLFRRLIHLPAIDPAPVEEKKSPRRKSPREDDKPEVEEAEREVTMVHDFLSMDAGVTLWLSDANASDQASLHTFSVDTDVTTTHPLLRLQQMRILRGGGGVVITATLRATGSPLPAGTWSFTTFSESCNPDSLSLNITDIDSESSGKPVLYQFGASYIPNKNLRLFRDIIEIPPKCFPLYMNIDVSYNSADSKLTGLRLPVRFEIRELTKRGRRHSAGKYEKDSAVTVAKNADASAGDAIIKQVGFRVICLPCFWPKQAKKSDAQLATEARVQLLIEAELDSDVLHVDKALRSPRPYIYNNSAEFWGETLLSKVTVEQPVQWVLTLYSAAEGLLIRHDSYEEKARHALRKSWEAVETGRADRAAAVHAHYLRSNASQSPGQNQMKDILDNEPSIDDHINMARTTALGSKLVTPELEIEREEKRTLLYDPMVETWLDHCVDYGKGFNNAGYVEPDARDRGAIQMREKTKHVANLIEWRQVFVEGTVGSLKAREQHRIITQQKTAALVYLLQQAQNAALKIKHSLLCMDEAAREATESSALEGDDG